MTKEASQIIRDIAESIKNNPAQFQLEINIIGNRGSAMNGGVGQMFNTVGGGSGSNTTGLNVPMNQFSIEIANQNTNTAIAEKMIDLHDTLNKIAAAIEEGNKGLAQKLISSLPNWVPDLIIKVLSVLLGNLGTT